MTAITHDLTSFVNDTKEPITEMCIKHHVSIKEEIKTNPVSLTADTVIVYNGSDIESVLGAAIVHSEHPHIKVMEAGKNIPNDAGQYVWLGIEPTSTPIHEVTDDKIWKANHFVFLSDKPVQSASIKRTSVKYSFPEVEFEAEVQLSMLEKFLTLLLPDVEKYSGVAFIAHRFCDRSMDIDSLAFIYATVKAAERSLEYQGKPFHMEAPNQNQLELYIKAVQEIKKELSGNYSVRQAYDDKKTVSTIITCISKDFWLARRIIGFSDRKFINVVMTLNGPTIQTNLNAAKNINLINHITTTH